MGTILLLLTDKCNSVLLPKVTLTSIGTYVSNTYCVRFCPASVYYLVFNCVYFLSGLIDDLQVNIIYHKVITTMVSRPLDDPT